MYIASISPDIAFRSKKLRERGKIAIRPPFSIFAQDPQTANQNLEAGRAPSPVSAGPGPARRTGSI